MSTQYINIDDIDNIEDPRLTGKSKGAKKSSAPRDFNVEHFDWDNWWKVLDEHFPTKTEHVPARKIGERPIERECIEDATDDWNCNAIRRFAMMLLKKGQAVEASKLCRLVARWMLEQEFKRGKIQDYDKDTIRLRAGQLVQHARKGLVMRFDPVLCVNIKGRWIIKRRD